MTDHLARGRLFVVTGPDAAARADLAGTLARRAERAVAIDAAVFDGMVVAGRAEHAVPPTVEEVKQLFLRWSAAIATAETYLLEGFDAVISDAVLGDFLDDFLDLVTPEPVHLVVVHRGHVGVRGTPRYGLWVDVEDRSPDEVVEAVRSDPEASLVVTDDQG